MPNPLTMTLRNRLDNLLFHLLLALVIGLAGWLSLRYVVVWDWSDQGRNSLGKPSRQLLERLDAPLKITSFAPDNPQLRGQIREIVARYQRYRPDIRLEFVDPARHPALTRELGIRVAGELHLEYRKRSENLQQLDEQHLSNAIQRLIRQGENRISFIEGHGERRPSGQANHDLGGFGAELERKGYRLQPLDLTVTPDIPENTGLLVIASPQADYLPGEVERILGYVRNGGNLLWLLEPDGVHGLEPLARLLGLKPLPGTLVDANAAGLGLDDPAMAVVPRYPDHPATARFDLITLFPHSAGLSADPVDGWETTPLLQTLARSWNETGQLRGKLERNPEQGEREGPLTIGLALTAEGTERQQRLLVIGDGDFLSNTYLGNGGNLDLGLNLIRWLTWDDDLIDIPARTDQDQNLNLSPLAGTLIGLGFLLALPFALGLTGGVIWWRRRRM